MLSEEEDAIVDIGLQWLTTTLRDMPNDARIILVSSLMIACGDLMHDIDGQAKTIKFYCEALNNLREPPDLTAAMLDMMKDDNGKA